MNDYEDTVNKSNDFPTSHVQGCTLPLHSQYQEYTGYDHSNYVIPHIPRDAVEISFRLEVKSNSAESSFSESDEKINQIQQSSGASVHIDVPTSPNTVYTIEIRGFHLQLTEALESMKKSVLKAHAIVNEKALILLRVPPEMIGCLIGKAGKNIKSIKESTRACIRVDVLDEKCQIQTVRINGGIEEVLDAHQRVCDSLRTFDPKKSRMMKEAGGDSNFDSSPKSRAIQFGGSPGHDIQSSIQTSFTIQIPSPSPMKESIPSIMVLQSDGSYQPASVTLQNLPMPATRDNVLRSSISSSSATCVSTIFETDDLNHQ